MLVRQSLSAIVLAAAFAAPLAAGAQSAPAPAPGTVTSPPPMSSGAHHHHRKSAFFRALDTLNLTPDQQQQVDGFRTAEHTANANADQPTREANAAKMREQIIGILTPDQKAQLDTAMHRSHKGAPDAAATPAPGSN